MEMKLVRTLVGVLISMMLVMGLAGSAWAGRQAPESPQPQTSPGLTLRLAGRTFDPLTEQSLDAGDLRIQSYPGDGSGYYLVQFSGPITEADKAALSAAGAEVHDYIPDFAFIVKMNAAARAALEAQARVRWVGVYQPAYRLDTNLLAQPGAVRWQSKEGAADLTPMAESAAPTEVVVTVFRGEPLAPIVAQIAARGGQVLSQTQTEWRSKVRVSIAADQLTALAQINGVRWVEAAPRWQLHNDAAVDVMGVREVWDAHGLYGDGQTVAVCDTGLDRGSTSPASLIDDFEDGAGSSRVIAIQDLVGDGANDVNSGHGTHVAGSVLGNGAMSGATPDSHTFPAGAHAGAAPDAHLVFQASEDNDTGSLTGLPDDLNSLFSSADSAGADIHTNSWGGNTGGEYTSNSEEVDQYIWGHPQFSILFSAGNEGTDRDSNGVVDLYSLGSPATAKNCITVGASENDRPTITGDWGSGWPSDFPANPISDDLLADNPDGLAAFSSRGPALDGRLKPDVVAPGTFIASTKSQDASFSGTGWMDIDGDYMYMGGTSMATPLVAGTTALVREFYTDQSVTPSAALLKATLINGATDVYPGQYGTGSTQELATTRPTYAAGWGRVNLENSLFPTGARKMAYIDETTGLSTGGSNSYLYEVTSAAEPLRVTLVWSDYPGTVVASGGLVNDLDLTVTAPDNTTVHYPLGATANKLLAYDPNSVTNVYSWSAGKRVAVRFSATGGVAYRLQAGLFYLVANSYPKDFTWRVYANNAGAPGSQLASGTDTIVGPGWHAVDMTAANLSFNNQDFFVALEFSDDQLAWAYASPATGKRSWDYNGSAWAANANEDYMIRALLSSTSSADRTNNVEGVDIATPTTGVYTIRVTGYNTPHGPQPYALVVSGAIQQPAAAPTLAIPDQSVPMGEGRDNAVDLWAYAQDDDPDADLTFEITNTPDPDAGITLDSNRYIDIIPQAQFSGTVMVTVVVTDTDGETATDNFNVTVRDAVKIYMPVSLRRWPPLPYSVTLNAISNSSNASSYSVSWSSADLATTYELQEDDNSGFASPTSAYKGASTSWSASGKAPGTYYYRVRGVNSWGNGSWSNVQSTRVLPPSKFYASGDAPIYQALGGNNYGANYLLRTGYDLNCTGTLGGGVSRSLLRFDLSAIPAGTAISRAELHLEVGGTCYYTGYAQNRSVVSYRVTKDWTEGTVTWNSHNGSFAEAYGSTSIRMNDGTNTHYTIDVTNLVNAWINNQYPNYGLILRAPENNSTDKNAARIDFAAREVSGTSYDPYLQITYAGMSAAAAEVHTPLCLSAAHTFGPLSGIVLNTTAAQCVEFSACQP